MTNPRTIKIFDTTLRDGEQAPGYSMNLQEKITLAHQIERMGADIMEAGFPFASPEDFESVQEIARQIKGATICGLARCNEKDIDAAIRALEPANSKRIHVFIASSPLHMEYKLKMTPDQVIARAIAGVQQVKTFTSDIEFSPEDATRSDHGFLVELLNAVIEAGATTLNIPDTVGYTTPQEYGDLIKFLRANVTGADKVVFSTHCHNDLGLAVANSIAGVQNGAGQIECTINGIGERAGNAAVEEVIMAMKVRNDIYGVQTNIDTTQLVPASKLLQKITGQSIQRNKAIVGKNAFAHEAGIHQHGILANRETYEIMRAEDVGHSNNALVLGKHSGRNALKKRLEELNVDFDPAQLDDMFARFKVLADKKKHVYDEDLIFLAMPETQPKFFALQTAHVQSQQGQMALAGVSLRAGEEVLHGTGHGNGDIDALYTAIEAATGFAGKLTSFVIDALTPEQDATGVVNIEWELPSGQILSGYGTDQNIIYAAAKALVDILNKWKIREEIEKQ